MKKKLEEDHENLERWLLTYADLITLLMAFFTIMYAMASVNMAKFRTLAASMSMAFGSGGGGGKNMLTNYTGSGIKQDFTTFVNIKDNNEFKSVVKLIKEYAAKEGISKKVDAHVTERGLVVNLADSVLFESGSAELSPKAREILDRLADILFATKKQIRVEGHTDNVPIHTARYESNWQLSTDRATNVVIYWLGKHPDQAPNLSAAGYGEFRPIASNDSPEGRSLNRRVDMVILREIASRKEPVPSVTTEPAPGSQSSDQTKPR
ncbi:MAG: OmpA family protein [Bacillota bacterium]